MLSIIIKGEEGFNEDTQTFSMFDDVTLELEHSLLSVSKWESKYQKPFLDSDKKSIEEVFDYIKLMVITTTKDLDALYICSQDNVDTIQRYIDSTQSATTFGVMPKRQGPSEIITSELIYYWMVSFNIPFECEKWHLNRLFSLIRICNIKNSKEETMPKHELAQRNHDLNAKRKAELGTTG